MNKTWGILFQPGALWIGAHYSRYDRRWCINVLPMLTLWICRKGGRVPYQIQRRPNVAIKVCAGDGQALGTLFARAAEQHRRNFNA